MEGIKKLLSAQTAGLPNWAWLLIIGGGVAIAIIAPKIFKGFGGSSDTTATTDTGTPVTPSTDMGGYIPAGAGAGGTLDGSSGAGTSFTPPQTPTSPDTSTPPSGVFPPIQPSAPPPPTGNNPPDQCSEQRKYIDFHVHHNCDKLKGTEKTKCIEHWTAKGASRHPCGHSLIPTVHTTNDIWPHNRQPRRNMAYMVDGHPVRQEDIGKSKRTRVDLPPIPETMLEVEEETDGNIQ